MRQLLLERFGMRVLVEVAAFVLLVVMLLAAQQLRVFEMLELAIYDWTLRLRVEEPIGDTRVVQILATEEDLNRLGWPLTDEVVTKVLSAALASSPKVVGLDVYREQPRPPGHEQLLALMKERQEIYAVYKFASSKRNMVPPPAVLEEAGRAGFADWVVDADGTVRQGLLFLSRDGESRHSFAFLLGLEYLYSLGITPEADPDNPQYLRIGKTTLPPLAPDAGGYTGHNPGGYRFLLDFKGGENPFATYSYLDLLEGRIPPEKIKGRIVVIGTGADSVKDQFLSPFNRGGDSEHPFIFGPTLHAHSVNQILRMALEGSGRIDAVEQVWELLWVALGVFAGLVVGRTPFRPAAFILRTGIFGALPLFIQLVLIHFYIWLPSLVTTVGFFLASVFATALASQHEHRQTRLLKALFDKSVSPAVAEEILANRGQVVGEGKIRTQNLTATVLFTDLANFTPVAEKMEPESLMNWLNEYMGTMAEEVMNHGGVVDKYIGDAIMALFGVPMARTTQGEIEQDVINAVSCALSMGRALEEELIPEWRRRGLPEIGMRVGIHTGKLVAGGLGHQDRMDYTVIGDAVNVAARLESLKPGEGISIIPSVCRILVSEAALDCLQDKFITSPVGQIILKGRSVTLAVHQVRGLKVK